MLFIVMFCDGYVLFEGIFGFGKMKFVQMFGQVFDFDFVRIQFILDFMFGDIIGINIVDEDELGYCVFCFQKGLIFVYFIFVDEINCVMFKMQLVLFEVMQEKMVSVGQMMYIFDLLFFVFVIQNLFEMEGIYFLFEVQFDCFLFKFKMIYLSVDELQEIMDCMIQFEQFQVEIVFDGLVIFEMCLIVCSVLIFCDVQSYVICLVLVM